MGAECPGKPGLESKRPRRHRAVARALVVQRRSLVWPVTASARWRLVPRTPRHMPRRSSRSLGCAVAARRLLPLSPLLRRFRYAHASRSRRPFQSLEAPCRAGSSARLRWGGGAVSAANAGIKDAPSSPRSSSEGGLASRWFNVLRDSDASRTTLSLHRGDLFSARAPLRSARHRAASPNIRRSMFRCSGLPSQATHSTYPQDEALSRGCSHIERSRVATPGGHAPRQAVASLCACHGIVLAYPCEASAPSSLRPRQETSVRRRVRPVKKESLHAPPKVGFDTLIAAWLEIDQESGD